MSPSTASNGNFQQDVTSEQTSGNHQNRSQARRATEIAEGSRSKGRRSSALDQGNAGSHLAPHGRDHQPSQRITRSQARRASQGEALDADPSEPPQLSTRAALIRSQATSKKSGATSFPPAIPTPTDKGKQKVSSSSHPTTSDPPLSSDLAERKQGRRPSSSIRGNPTIKGSISDAADPAASSSIKTRSKRRATSPEASTSQHASKKQKMSSSSTPNEKGKTPVLGSAGGSSAAAKKKNHRRGPGGAKAGRMDEQALMDELDAFDFPDEDEMDIDYDFEEDDTPQPAASKKKNGSKRNKNAKPNSESARRPEETSPKTSRPESRHADRDSGGSRDRDEDPSASMRAEALENALRLAAGGAMSGGAAEAFLRNSGFLSSLYGLAGGFSSNVGNKWKRVVKDLQSSSSSVRLQALNQAAEDLAISMEDQLLGFPTDLVVAEFLRILDGRPYKAEGIKRIEELAADEQDNEDEDEEEDDEEDEDAQLARILAMTSPNGADVGAVGSEDDMQAALLACRCLANLLEVLPGTSHVIVSHDGVKILCSKLIGIEYIELAEQVLQTLEKISTETPGAIVRAGGLHAMLQYLDFFSTYVQRTAVTAAANCCRSIAQENFDKVQEVLPILRSVLGYSDSRLVEQATIAHIRIVESWRYKGDLIEKVLHTETLQSLNSLLSPAVGASVLSDSTFTQLIRALTQAARSSTKVCITLYDAGVPAAMYYILTGVLPSSRPEDSEDPNGGSKQLDAAIIHNINHRPKEHIEEALACICEMLPPVPRDGIFEPRNYSEKNVGRYAKAKSRLEREHPSGYTSAQLEDAVQAGRRDSAAKAAAEIESPLAENEPSLAQPSRRSTALAGRSYAESNEQRIAQYAAASEKVLNFIQAVVPLLVDVFSASAANRIRAKVLTGLVKALVFSSGEQLKRYLKNVPLAGFLCSILSARDDPAFVLASLQITELLLHKLPDVYTKSFHREGVFHEICALADQDLSSRKSKSGDATQSNTASTPAALPESRQPAEDLFSDPSMGDLGDIVQRIEQARNQLRNPSAGPKRANSVPTDPHDANIVRARILRIKWNIDMKETGDQATSQAMDILKRAASVFSSPSSSEDEHHASLREIASLLLNENEPLSSFELLQSGLLNGLVSYVTFGDQQTKDARRRQLHHALRSTADKYGISAFDVFVKRLQESLSRLEAFEVETASLQADDRRNPLANLVRQIRIRLKADDPDSAPKAYQDMIVSVQAIAPLSAISAYLRSRISNDRFGGGGAKTFYEALASAGAAANDGSPRKSRKASTEGTDAAKQEKLHTSAMTQPGAPPLPGLSERSSVQGRGEESEDVAATAATPDMKSSNAPSSGSGADEGEGTADREGQFRWEDNSDIIFERNEDDEEDDDEYSDEENGILFEHALDDDIEEQEEASEEIVEKTVDLAAGVSPPKGENGSQAFDSTKLPASAAPADCKAESPAKNKAGSYAAALKASPSDWHFQLLMDGKEMPGHQTVYGALHRSARSVNGAQRPNLWLSQPTITFRKVSGPPASSVPAAQELVVLDPASAEILPQPLVETSPQATLLRLLKVLHAGLGSVHRAIESGTGQDGVDESLFINPKINAKFIRQLEELVIVASNCLPDWAVALPTHFPFLFPFEARFTFLQSTSFGYSRLIGKWLSQQSPMEAHRRSGMLDSLPRPQRSRVRIIRPKILESASRVMELYGQSSGIIEIEYQNEPGTGLGPTLEFYTLVSKAFAERDLNLWRDDDPSGSGNHVVHPRGLYPKSLSQAQVLTCPPKSSVPYFKTLGAFVAKALLDSRIIDLHFHPLFMSAILGQNVPMNVGSLALVNPSLSKTLRKLQALAEEKKSVLADQTKSETEKSEHISSLQLDGVQVEELGLDFTLPGQPEIELVRGGSEVALNVNNLEEYIDLVVNAILGDGVSRQIAAFREGFSQIFPISDLRIFSPAEMVLLFGNSDEDWSRETLEQNIKADHGYNSESRIVKQFIDFMTELTIPERRVFLQFATGAPKLPIGGFRGLHPQFTVVKKPHEHPYKADDYLPSVMTCAQYLKLPEYSSKEILVQQLRKAMKEGAGSFLLS